MVGNPCARSGGNLGAARAAALALAILSGSAAQPASANHQPRRIYFLESLQPTQPAGVATLEAFRQRLRENSAEQFEILVDFLELGRFPGEAHEERTARYLAEKYAQAPPALLITLGRGAAQYLAKYRDMLGRDIPAIVASVPTRSPEASNLPPNSVGVVTEYNSAKTLELARALQPDARNLAIVAGASDYDRAWLEEAKRELAPSLGRYNTIEIVGLPYDDTLKRISLLSRDTIVLMLFFFNDGGGRARVPTEVAADVARISPVPVYASAGSFFGRGIVGGYMDTFEAHGVAAADLAVAILAGRNLSALPRQTRAAHVYRVDARQMEKWGLAEARLPANAVVSFKQPTVWEQHRTLVLVTIAVFALQSLFVTGLLIQRRRRQQAEDLLKESEERMTFTAASVNVGLWQFDRTTDELWATEHCRALFGLAADVPLTRETFLAAVHPEDRTNATAWLRNAARTGQPALSDFRIVLPDGQVRWVRVQARSHADDRGAPDRLSGIFVDITEQKAAEAEADEQRQEVTHLMRVSVLGELSGAIAHEINQPLTAILSNAQAALYLLAQKSPDLAEVRDALQDIVHEDNRAGEVIQRLRNLLKKGERKSEWVAVNDLVNSTVELLNSELIDRRIDVEFDLAAGLPETTGDLVQLQQVLLNLFMNAMDAMASTPRAQRRITVVTRLAQAGGVEVLIKDCGPGIRSDAQSRLFKPFYTSKEKGLGLGLTICSTIAQAHGGKLTLANHADGGAVATFSLPVQEFLVAAK